MSFFLLALSSSCLFFAACLALSHLSYAACNHKDMNYDFVEQLCNVCYLCCRVGQNAVGL